MDQLASKDKWVRRSKHVSRRVENDVLREVLQYEVAGIRKRADLPKRTWRKQVGKEIDKN